MTYRATNAARGWCDDLAVAAPLTLLAIGAELLLGRPALTEPAVRRTSGIAHALAASSADRWFPALMAGVVLLVCLRLRRSLGPDPGLPRFGLTMLTGAAVFGLAALRLAGDFPGSVWARYLPLAGALLAIAKVPGWLERTSLREPTRCGFRPRARALLHPRSLVALRICSHVPAHPMWTTDAVDHCHERGIAALARAGDTVSEAYVRVRVIEHLLALSDISGAEARVNEALSCARVRDEPAVLSAHAELLIAIGDRTRACRVLKEAEKRLGDAAPAAFGALLTRVRAGVGLVDAPHGGGLDLRRARLLWSRRPGTVLLETAASIEAAMARSPEAALPAAKRLLAVAEAIISDPDMESDLDEVMAVLEARATALMVIARFYASRGWHLHEASALLEAFDDLQVIKERTRASACLVRAAGLRLRDGCATAAEEAHALDLMRAGFQLVESERGALRGGTGRAAWVRDQRSLYAAAFDDLARHVTWHPRRAGELALWLLESLHRTTLASALAGNAATRDSRLDALVEELVVAEAPGGAVDASEVSRRRAKVAAQFAQTRDAELVVNPVDVPALRSRLRGAAALVYQCARDDAGWQVNGVLVAPAVGEVIVRARIDGAQTDDPVESPCALLDAIAARRHGPVARAFGVPLWETVWTKLGEALLPPELVTALAASGGGLTQELVIVPDGPLAGVPFAGLRLVDGRTLADAALVRHVPSLTLLRTEGPRAEDRASIVVTHVGSELEAYARPSPGEKAPAIRATGTRAELESALRAEPRPELAVILAHGSAGASTFDNELRLRDSSMSALAALRLPWPRAVIVGSCWIGAADVRVGEEPFGLPIACMLRGADVVVGAVAPTPQQHLREVLARVAKAAPGVGTLGGAVRAALVSPEEAGTRAWRDAPPMRWACVTTWSIVPIGGEPVAPSSLPPAWDAEGLPVPDRPESSTVPSRAPSPPADPPLAVLEEQERFEADAPEPPPHPLPAVRNARRWAWGAVAVALTFMGASLETAGTIQERLDRAVSSATTPSVRGALSGLRRAARLRAVARGCATSSGRRQAGARRPRPPRTLKCSPLDRRGVARLRIRVAQAPLPPWSFARATPPARGS